MNFFRKLFNFFRDAYYELTKVVWLGKKEAVGTTVVVVIFVVIMSVFVAIVDLILGHLIGFIL
jgi:preprotein translocase subunit SecE